MIYTYTTKAKLQLIEIHNCLYGSKLNGILQWSLVSLTKRPLMAINRLVLAQMEIITIFITATNTCLFHRLRQTAMMGIF